MNRGFTFVKKQIQRGIVKKHYLYSMTKKPHNSHRHSSDITGKKLFLTIILNFIITVAQTIGGVLSGSLALISDALHNLSDGIAVLLAWIANKLMLHPGTDKRTFGLRRSETLAAFINSLALIAISIYLMVESVSRFSEIKEIDGDLMFWMGVVGLVANTFSVLLLRGDSAKNLNVKAAYLHLLGDAMTSVAVIVGALLIKFWNIYWIDPLVTLLISFYILFHTVSILKESTMVLMQFTPPGIDISEIRRRLKKVSGIDDLHHIHVWSLSEKQIHFEAHVTLVNDENVSETGVIRHRAVEVLKNDFNIEHVTLQFEYGDAYNHDLILENCDDSH
jgi:cobalt-zinc-cadmium efflux system protein